MSAPILANNYFGLDKSLALITGASSGLGQHFATVLAKAGCKVILCARNEEKLKSLLTTITDTGGQAEYIVLDVSDRAAAQQAIDNLIAKHGVPTVLVNNAGTVAGGSFLNTTPAELASVVSVNQIGAWHIAQITCQHMVTAEQPGCVINIASILGLDVMKGVAGYAVSKAAIVQMTKMMALELARYDIRVNAIAPGYFETDMNTEFLQSDTGKKLISRVPMRRVGQFEDLDGTLLLLASNKGAFMTGSVVPVDGGHLVAGLD